MRKGSIQRIRSIARLAFLDGLRRKALLGLVLLMLVAEGFGLQFMDFFGRDIGRASSDFLFSVIWFGGLMFLFFHAVQVIALDEERKTINLIISRPVSRAEYVLGTFSGLAFLLICIHLVLGAVAYGTLTFIRSLLDVVYFTAFDSSHFVLAWGGILLMELVLLSIIMLLSGLVRGGFPVFLLSLSYYFICNGLPVVREQVHQLVAASQASPINEKLLMLATAIFPDFGRLDFKDFVVSNAALSNLPDIVAQFSLGFVYLAIALSLACLAYSRRDLQ